MPPYEVNNIAKSPNLSPSDIDFTVIRKLYMAKMGVIYIILSWAPPTNLLMILCYTINYNPWLQRLLTSEEGDVEAPRIEKKFLIWCRLF